MACLGSPNLDVTLAAMRATSAFIQARGSALGTLTSLTAEASVVMRHVSPRPFSLTGPLHNTPQTTRSFVYIAFAEPFGSLCACAVVKVDAMAAGGSAGGSWDP